MLEKNKSSQFHGNSAKSFVILEFQVTNNFQPGQDTFQTLNPLLQID